LNAGIPELPPDLIYVFEFDGRSESVADRSA
jgi:hypothetical protein